MHETEPNIQIPVDLTNPGQFFACCGLLEPAHRLWPGAEGWFGDAVFQLRVDSPFEALFDALRQGTIKNTMSAAQMVRLEGLSAMSKKDREKARLEGEKKALDALRREGPILFQSPLVLRIAWFQDEDSGGSRFKTWAGQRDVERLEQTRLADKFPAGLLHDFRNHPFGFGSFVQRHGTRP